MNKCELLSTASGVVGGVIAYLVGPIDALVQVALVMMCIDVLMGVICAINSKSTKTEHGALSSGVFRRGLTKKCGEMLLIIVGHMLDVVTGMSAVKAGVCVALIVNEGISLLENAGSLGICDVPVLTKALEVLKEKGSEK